jgi:hypothetical protein
MMVEGGDSSQDRRKQEELQRNAADVHVGRGRHAGQRQGAEQR